MSSSLDLDWLKKVKASLIVSLLIFIVSLLFVHNFAAVFLYFFLIVIYLICTCVRSWSLHKDTTIGITDVIDEGCFSQELKVDSIRIAVLSCVLELLTVQIVLFSCDHFSCANSLLLSIGKRSLSRI